MTSFCRANIQAAASSILRVKAREPARIGFNFSLSCVRAGPYSCSTIKGAAVTAALVIAARGTPERRGGYIFTNGSVFSLALIFFALAHSFWFAFSMLVVMGATMVGTLTLTNTTLQMTTPAQLRGRVMSIYYMAMSGLLPLGSLQAGAVAEALGARFALAFGGAVCLVYFLTLLILLPRLRKAGKLPRPEIAEGPWREG